MHENAPIFQTFPRGGHAPDPPWQSVPLVRTDPYPEPPPLDHQNVDPPLSCMFETPLLNKQSMLARTKDPC